MSHIYLKAKASAKQKTHDTNHDTPKTTPKQNKTAEPKRENKTTNTPNNTPTTRRQHPKRIENLVIRFRLGTFSLPSRFFSLALFLFRFVFGMNLFSREKFFISNNESRSDRRFLNAHPPYTTYTPV